MRKLFYFLGFCLSLASVTAIAAKQPPEPVHYRVIGIEDPALSNVNSHLHFMIESLGANPSAEQLRQFYQSSQANVKKALQPFGYFNPTIQLQIISKKKIPELIYSIDSGKQIRVTHLTIEVTGPGANALMKTRTQLPLAQGLPLNILDYTHSKQQLLDTAHAIGYLKAALVIHEVKIDLRSYTASIHLQLDTGEQYYFGRIYVNHTQLDPKFIRRYINFKPGDPYSEIKLGQLQQAYSSSGYFSRVQIQPQLGKATNRQVPITIHFKMRKSQAYSIGVGYGTDTSFHGNFGWEWRRLTATGHHMSALIEGGLKHHQAIQARYIIPGKNPATDEYLLAATLFHLDTDTSDSKGILLSASYLTTSHLWQRTLALKFLSEAARDQPSLPDKTTSLLYPNIVWHRVKAEDNDTITVSKGYSATISFQGSVNKVLSQVSFAQGLLDAKGIYSLDKTRFIGRITLGMTGISNINDLPPSLQFKTGGAQSIRGYDFDSIGPDKNILIASGEIQHRIYKNLGLGAFYDVGNTFHNSHLTLRHSVGLNFIYFSAIGPIELGLAHPMTQTNKDITVVFTMGPDLQ